MKLALVLAGLFAVSVSASSGTGSSTIATPTCGQTRVATVAPAATAVSVLASASAVSQACDTTKQHQWKQGNVTTNYWSFGSYYFNISQIISLGVRPLSLPAAQACQDTFNNILSSCLTDTAAPAPLYESGWLLIDGFNYSISNADYPKNPVLVASASTLLNTASAPSGVVSSGKDLPQQATGSTLSDNVRKSFTGPIYLGSIVPGSSTTATSDTGSSSLASNLASSSMTLASAANSSLTSLHAGMLPPAGVSGSGTGIRGTGTSITSASVSTSSSSMSAGVMPLSGPSRTETGTERSQITSTTSSASSTTMTLMSSPSGVNISGVGVLPFSLDAGSTGSSSSTPNFIPILGAWIATPTAATVAPPYFLIPTTTGAAATSEAPLIAGLLFALVRDKDWLKDDKLQDQYVRSVERTQDENNALLRDSPAPPNVPTECGSYKRKRSFLSPVIDTLKDAVQVLACTKQQLNLLHGLLVAPVVAIDLALVDDTLSDLEDLANKLQKDDEERPSNSVSNSKVTSTTREVSSSSSSSSSSSPSSSESLSIITISEDTPLKTLPDDVNAYMASIVEAKIASEDLLSGLSLSMGTMTGSTPPTIVANTGSSPSTSTAASTAPISAAAQASLASAASVSAASVSAAAASSQYLATVFNPAHTTTSCGQTYGSGSAEFRPTAVPRLDTHCVAEAIADFCTPPDGPLILKANDPAYHNYGLPKPHNDIVFQLAFEWDPRPECHTAGSSAPRLSPIKSSGRLNPDPVCSDAFHGLLDGCDAADGQDKHGGRIYTGCATYEWAAFVPPKGFEPVTPWKGPAR